MKINICYNDVFPIKALYEESDQEIYAVIDVRLKGTSLEEELIQEINLGNCDYTIIK